MISVKLNKSPRLKDENQFVIEGLTNVLFFFLVRRTCESSTEKDGVRGEIEFNLVCSCQQTTRLVKCQCITLFARLVSRDFEAFTRS